ncbi:MAG: hypothetical protein ACREMY_02840, partial [bacterium]
LDLDGQVHPDTHALPMGNYVIRVGNYVIATPSEVGNYKIADSQPATTPDRAAGQLLAVTGRSVIRVRLKHCAGPSGFQGNSNCPVLLCRYRHQNKPPNFQGIGD